MAPLIRPRFKAWEGQRKAMRARKAEERALAAEKEKRRAENRAVQDGHDGGDRTCGTCKQFDEPHCLLGECEFAIPECWCEDWEAKHGEA